MSWRFSRGVNPPAKPAETSNRGRCPSIRAFGGGRRFRPAGSGKHDNRMAAVQIALAGRESRVRESKRLLRASLRGSPTQFPRRTPRPNPQDLDASAAGAGLRLNEPLPCGFRQGLADLGLGRVVQPGLDEGAKKHAYQSPKAFWVIHPHCGGINDGSQPASGPCSPRVVGATLCFRASCRGDCRVEWITICRVEMICPTEGL